MNTSESNTPPGELSGRLTDEELVTAFREQPIAERTASEVDEAARRFVRATQERIAVRQRTRTFTARWFVPALVVAAVTLFALGRAVSMSFVSGQRASDTGIAARETRGKTDLVRPGDARARGMRGARASEGVSG